jgi:hypothetical protein
LSLGHERSDLRRRSGFFAPRLESVKREKRQIGYKKI